MKILYIIYIEFLTPNLELFLTTKKIEIRVEAERPAKQKKVFKDKDPLLMLVWCGCVIRLNLLGRFWHQVSLERITTAANTSSMSWKAGIFNGLKSGIKSA